MNSSNRVRPSKFVLRAISIASISACAGSVGLTSPALLVLAGSVAVPAFAQAALPVITSPLAASAVIGKAFAYQIAATNSPTSYNAGGMVNGDWMLAPGVDGNPNTGQLFGTPTIAGVYNIPNSRKKHLGGRARRA